MISHAHKDRMSTHKRRDADKVGKIRERKFQRRVESLRLTLFRAFVEFTFHSAWGGALCVLINAAKSDCVSDRKWKCVFALFKSHFSITFGPRQLRYPPKKQDIM